MKKTYIMTAAVVSICLIVTAVTRAAANNFTPAGAMPESTDSEETVLTETEDSATELQKIYLLTEKDGKIVVYQEGIVNPVEITDTYVRDLPEYDREKIRSGIKIHGDTALRRALEDFCS